MSKFVDGIKSLFSGDSSQNKANQDLLLQNQQQQEQQAIALDKQTQDLQAKNDEEDQLAGRALRAPKGRRLLLAATGENGVSNTLGG
jgi:hypothetical protein